MKREKEILFIFTLLFMSFGALAADNPCEVNVGRNTAVADVLINKRYSMIRNREVSRYIQWDLKLANGGIEQRIIANSTVAVFTFNELQAYMEDASGKIIWSNSIAVQIQSFKELSGENKPANLEISRLQAVEAAKFNAALTKVFETLPACR